MSLNIVQRELPGWGVTYGPSGDGPFPAIMLLHGSEGAWAGWSHRDAMLFAAHGFLSFPYGYSSGGNAWNAGHIIDYPLDRSVEAFKALWEFQFADERVGLYGLSRGAEHALLLASLIAKDKIEGAPDAIAVHSPPDVVCGAFAVQYLIETSAFMAVFLPLSVLEPNVSPRRNQPCQSRD